MSNRTVVVSNYFEWLDTGRYNIFLIDKPIGFKLEIKIVIMMIGIISA